MKPRSPSRGGEQMPQEQVLPETGLLLFELAPRLTRLENLVLKELAEPLTFRQYRLLTRVAAGISTLTDLRAPTTLSLAAVSESVDVLVQRGLLARRVHDSDRRAVTISATPAGRRALAAAAAELDELARDLVADLTVDDGARLHTVVGELTDRVTDGLRSR